MSEGDRRAPGATRIPFEAMVEVGGATGPAFEAQAVDVSLEGMHLRTAYLPEVGQPLTCRFDAGPREMVLASGEVVWSREAARGGEFGIRFANLDADSARILGQMMCVEPPPAARDMHAGAPPYGGPPAADFQRGGPPAADFQRRGAGMKVRLHIDGLGSPMKARVKGMQQAELTVGSELGFLQVGKGLELENAETGRKRPAVIDRVEVQVDPGSQVPELVVALKYADEYGPLETAKTVRGVGPVAPPVEERRPMADPREMRDMRETRDTRDMRETREVREEPREVLERADTMTAEAVVPPPPSDGGVDVEVTDTDHGDPEGHAPTAADRMKGAFSRSAAKVTPAINAFAQRAKTTFALLAARKWRDQRDGREGKDDVGIPMRRVTAPPPGGGLHAEGRKVVREFGSLRDGLDEKPAGLALDKKKMVLGGVAGVLLILGAVAMRKPAAPPPAPEAAASEAPMASAAAADSVAPAPSAAPAPNAGNALANAPAPSPQAETAPGSNVADATPQRDEGRRAAPPRRIAVAPFTNGSVPHGNVLRLRMDGAIEKINGAAQPTGFTVVIPSRRSLEAAAPLAARDGRIASIKVVNDAAGAELSVTFKDGVPNYAVRAKGETLEIVLAPAGRMSSDRQELAEKAHDGHDSPRAHATPNNGGKRKHPAKKH